MSDIFISYARSTAAKAEQIGDAMRALGYSVWRDDELPAHRAYSDVIEAQLKAAKAVLVIWSADAVKSDWVRSEADHARNLRKLVQVTLDGTALPMPFDQIQCANLVAWDGNPQAAGWRTVLAGVSALTGSETESSTTINRIATIAASKIFSRYRMTFQSASPARSFRRFPGTRRAWSIPRYTTSTCEPGCASISLSRNGRQLRNWF